MFKLLNTPFIYCTYSIFSPSLNILYVPAAHCQEKIIHHFMHSLVPAAI